MTPPLLGGRYRLERRLGLGGMSVVHLAHDEVLDRPVAVKLLADRLEGDPEMQARFLREGQMAARLSHPNVVAVYDTGDEKGQPYIVMEYVEGVTLAEHLASQRTVPAEEIAEFGAQVCAGLAHAHAAGLVHRDVKPHNLLLRVDGTLKVADFGIARGGIDRTLTQAGTLLGTAAYMAPEVIRGKKATVTSDLYSLGAVLYELLTGQTPRRIDSFADLGELRPITEPGRLVPDPPPELVATIMRCLEEDPLRRPASALELAAALDDSEAPTRQLRPGDGRTGPARGRWVTVAGGVAALVAALAVSFGGQEDSGEPTTPAPVAPVPTGSNPAEAARNLSAWLRANSG
ncbi:MAG TPA: serine/threonine-protein kinase [Gaiellaceae bacterium]|nr:serine/threonine-protein kinase [Gaiellaceae bacterium]